MTRGQEGLRALLQRAAGTQDPDERYAIAVELQSRTDRPTFEAACALAWSNGLDERVLGLDILSQLGYPARAQSESYRRLFARPARVRTVLLRRASR